MQYDGCSNLQDPPPLPYLAEKISKNYDIQLEVLAVLYFPLFLSLSLSLRYISIYIYFFFLLLICRIYFLSLLLHPSYHDVVHTFARLKLNLLEQRNQVWSQGVISITCKHTFIFHIDKH